MLDQLCLKRSRQGCDTARLSHTWLQPGVREPRIRPKPFKTVSKASRQPSHPAKARCELERKQTFEAKPAGPKKWRAGARRYLDRRSGFAAAHSGKALPFRSGWS